MNGTVLFTCFFLKLAVLTSNPLSSSGDLSIDCTDPFTFKSSKLNKEYITCNWIQGSNLYGQNWYTAYEACEKLSYNLSTFSESLPGIGNSYLKSLLCSKYLF
jgi:hypothetical protein